VSICIGSGGRLLRGCPVKKLQKQREFHRLLFDNGITCSMSRAGNVWDNSAMESFLSSLKTERTARKVYRTNDAARAGVFDYIERFLQYETTPLEVGLSQPHGVRRPRYANLIPCPRNRQQPICGNDIMERRFHTASAGRVIVSCLRARAFCRSAASPFRAFWKHSSTMQHAASVCRCRIGSPFL